MGMPVILLSMTFFVIISDISVLGSSAPTQYNNTLSRAPSPLVSVYKHRYKRKKFSNHAPEPSKQISPQGPLIATLPSPWPSSKSWSSPTPSPSTTIPSRQFEIPMPPPTISPLSSSLEKKASPPLPVLLLPPPPPNQDCTTVRCTEPLTYTPAGTQCSCVWPIEVRLSIRVALYTFFPLVSELAKEIAAGVSLNQSQVRIMGANADVQQLEETTVLVHLVPLQENFDPTHVFSIYKKFWERQVFIRSSLFGAYQVVYVHYPGLPPSPPSIPSSPATIDDLTYPSNGNDGMPIKPLGVDVPTRRKDGTRGSTIAVVVLSSVTAFVVCMGVLWILLLKCGCSICQPKQMLPISSSGKPSGAARSLTLGSRPSSAASMSFSSSLLACTGTAKIFSLNEIERVTDNFDSSRILGEGGFGLVYSGVLDDERKVAVKVLKRDDQQGGREFLAEVEMLSRLHHRNLVKLIGICTEEHCRCLIYELVPNGSVESHLHGVDNETAPLDWCVRMKIALGAARGLAYLHEDSSPRVIHRDFKSSNILLENDFTPKVSDFGLARSAVDDGNKQHISTHVMGTFGYLAPEYAMTGHLLVKSDVYSYGVVLLELLTGRKPIDLSQPPGQENLVAWARPLLTAKEDLESIVDPTLKLNIPFDSVAKVAAIASMCVQPEVSHRPFMGEVVQALKLVCNEFDEIKEPISRSCSQEEFSVDIDKNSRASGELVEASGTNYPIMPGYDSIFDTKIPMSASDLRCVSAGFEGQDFGSFRRQSNSAPLKMGKRRRFWQRLRGISRGSMSDHELS
ncbi:hypothetical protein LguiA_010009 [Lonicera macranthoides]